MAEWICNVRFRDILGGYIVPAYIIECHKGMFAEWRLLWFGHLERV